MVKLFVLGIDGMAWELIIPWIEEGKLKNFQQVLDKGVKGKLRSTIPPITSPAIPCFYTGKNPGKLNITHFIRPEGPSITYKDVKSKAVWDYLSANNVKMCIVNLPITYPPKRINGVMISGPPVPSSRATFAHPPNVFKDRPWLLEGEYILDNINKILEEGEESLLEHVIKLTQNHFVHLKEISKEDYFELIIFYIRGSDILQHYLWNRTDLLLQYYIKVDRILGEILTEIKPDNLIIFSDHGFDKAPTRDFYINTWLWKKGYLHLTWKGKFLYSIVTPLVERFPELRKLGIKFLSNSKANNSTDNKRPIKLPGIDWKKTVAWADSNYGIRIKSEKKEEILKKIQDELKNITDNDGRPVMKIVKRREEEYSGKYILNAPDLLLVPEREYSIRLPIKRRIFEKKRTTKITGEHFSSLYGVFIAYGKDMKNNLNLNKKIIIYDITPTILHIFGLPIPNDMDGRVLTEIFNEDSEYAKRKPKYVDPRYYEKIEEHAKIKRALKKIKLRSIDSRKLK